MNQLALLLLDVYIFFYAVKKISTIFQKKKLINLPMS